MPHRPISWRERALLIAAFWPVWTWYAARLFDRSDEPWQILAVFSLLLLLPHQKEASAEKEISLLPPVVGLVLYLCVFIFVPPIVRAGIAILTVFLASVRIDRIPAGAYLLLALCLPVLPTMDFLLNFPLRQLTAIFSLPLLEGAGFHVGLSGNSFVWNGQLVLIDAPCSGVRMLYTMMLVTGVLSTALSLQSREVIRLLGISSVTVLAGNVFRASSLFFVEARPFCSELFLRYEAFLHPAVGLVVFALSVAFVTCLAMLSSKELAE